MVDSISTVHRLHEEYTQLGTGHLNPVLPTRLLMTCYSAVRFRLVTVPCGYSGHPIFLDRLYSGYLRSLEAR